MFQAELKKILDAPWQAMKAGADPLLAAADLRRLASGTTHGERPACGANLAG